jgi:beta-RFAP synthase
LHFGLFAFGDGHALQYGGVGLMLDQPSTRLQFSRFPELHLQVDDRPRVREIVKRWLQFRGSQCDLPALPEQLKTAIRQLDCPQSHIGLGSGTQLALAIATGLDRWFGITPGLTAIDAARFGRAKRSAVGTHGFFLGGLIVDRGKQADESIGRLEAHVPFPADWRVVLAWSRDLVGPSGETEDGMFRSLPPVTSEAADALRRIVDQRLLPAARAGDYPGFSRAVFDFGYRAGLSYKPFQQGAFRSPSVGELVDFLRSLGVEGVGQSSWGPLVFALCQDADQAKHVRERLATRFSRDEYCISISTINRGGHSVSECGQPTITMEEPLPRT